MATHLTGSQIEQFRARTLPPNEMVEADRHLWECDECRTRIDVTASVPRVRRAMRIEAELATPHFTYDQLKGSVDKEVSAAERMAMNRHLASCDSCSSDMRELETFSAEVAGERNRNLAAVAAAGPRFRAQRWRAGFAVAAMLLFVVAIGFLTRSGTGGSSTAALVGPQGEIRGRIELRDAGMVITADEDGTVRGIDSLPAEYRARLATTFQRLRQPAAIALPAPVPGDSTLLQSARAAYPRFHLLLGILALRAGRYPDAEVELRTLADANPESPAARRLYSEARQAGGSMR